jgi:O-antigen/teichoic acid export membrane protein
MKKIQKFLLNNTETSQTVIKNTFWLFSGEVLSRILKLVLIVYAARILGAAGWGAFSYGLSFIGLFFIFSDSGINGLVTREASKVQSDEKIQYLSTAFYIKTALSFFSLIIGVWIAPLFTTIKEAKAVIPLLALMFFFESMKEFGFSLNRAFERMEKEALVKIINNSLIAFFGILFLVFGSRSPESLAAAYAIGSCLGAILIFWMLRDQVQTLLSNFSKKIIRAIFVSSWSLAILILVGSIMDKTDAVMLSYWKNATEIGWYSAAQKIFQFLLAVPVMISLATFPRFSRFANKDNEQFTSIFEKSMRVLFLISLPIAIGGIIFGKELIMLLFGMQYLPAIPVFQIMMLLLPLAFSNILITNAIFAFDKQNKTVPYSIAGLILNITLNYVLIPHYGIIGSAIATVISWSFVVILLWIQLKKIQSFAFFSHVKKILFSACMMGVVSLTLKTLHIKIIPAIIISGVVYFTILHKAKEPLFQELKELLTR